MAEDSSLAGLLLQFVIALVIIIACMSIFELLRKAKPEIYSPKTHFNRRSAVKPAPSGMFAWIGAVWSVTDDTIDNVIGGDATILLLYLKNAALCFVAVAIVGVGLVLPVNLNGKAGATVVGLDKLSMANIKDESSLLWVHCVSGWAISMFAFAFLYRMHHRYIKIFHGHRLRILNTVTGRTLMVENIPAELCTDTAFQQYAEALPAGEVETVSVCKTSPKLVETLTLYDKALRQFESAVVSFSNNILKNRMKISATTGNEWLESLDTDTERRLWSRVAEDSTVLENIPRKFVPTAREKLINKVNALDTSTKDMGKYRARVLELRSKEDSYKNGPTAFLTLVKASDAIKGARTLMHSKPLRCMTSIAPEPRNIIWAHMPFGMKYSMTASLIVNIITVALTFLWLIPVGLIVSLTSLSQLSQWIPALGKIADSSPILRGFLQDVLPTILTAVLMSLLPTILYALTNQEKPKTFSSLEAKTFSRYYFFLIFNVFLVFTIGGTFIKSFDEIFDNPSSVVKILATQLPNNATFFINYVVLGLSAFATEMLQLPRLVFLKLKNFLFRTPRTRIEFFKKMQLSYYTTMPPFVLIFTISLAYSVIAPLITVFAALFFIFNYFAFKYQVMYVYSPAYETGGKMWPLLFDMTTTGIILYQLTLIGLLSLKKVVLPSIFVIPLVVLTLLVRHYCKKWLKQFAENLPLELCTDKSDANSDPVPPPRRKVPADAECVSPGAGSDTHTDAYFYEKEDRDNYINPALDTPLEEVWLPESMNSITDTAIDWSRCGRKAQ